MISNLIPSWSQTRPSVGDLAAGIGAGFFLLVLCHGTAMQLGGIDAWLYTGLIYGFRTLAEEFGVQYYSLRMAFLLPGIAFHELFGMLWGYLLLRVALVALLVVALARVARVFMSPGLARCLAVLAVLHPWVWRSVFWNYVDGVGLVLGAVVFASVISATASRSWKLRLSWSGVAGISLALAVNTNLFLLGVAGAAGLWMIIIYSLSSRWNELASGALAGAVGFWLTYPGLVAARYLLVPSQGWQWDILGLAMGANMANQGGAAWQMDSLKLIVEEGWFQLLIPVATLIVTVWSMWTVPREQREPIIAAGVILAVTVGLYIATEFVLRASVITLFFYFIYLVPAVFLAGSAVIGAISGGKELPTCWLIALTGIGIGSYLGREVLCSLSDATAAEVKAGVLVLAAGIGYLLRKRLSRQLLTVGAVMLGIGSQFIFYGQNRAYTPLSREQAEVEWDALTLGLELREILGEGPVENGKLAFWYGNTPAAEAPAFFDAMNGGDSADCIVLPWGMLGRECHS